ncbi:hypothetical protein M422DRAFT_56352 [Sphaerobolus stellatus SS14]|uniref:Uncharacterized protein n=1 Tax=Sphaerobolus stellatus (strain SS14) TaxID=990650 RepID=A0A0C9TRR1_SPHS4|nr:hypothetical protein M422DRAFT_56352 [Sphaerobolus stellatus SS14]
MLYENFKGLFTTRSNLVEKQDHKPRQDRGQESKYFAAIAIPKHPTIIPPSPRSKPKLKPTSHTRHPISRLALPKPRLSSSLSPKPSGTPLPGHEPRRPRPAYKRPRETPLLKQLLQKTVGPRYRAVIHGRRRERILKPNPGDYGSYFGLSGSEEAYEGLECSWVVEVPRDSDGDVDVDWEGLSGDFGGLGLRA